MKKKKRAKSSKKEHHKTLKFFFFAGFVVLLGFALLFRPSQKLSIISVASEIASRNSLQLETFLLPTKKPTPTSPVLASDPPTSQPQTLCGHDNGSELGENNTCVCIAWYIKCEANRCVDYNPEKSNLYGAMDPNINPCDFDSTTGTICNEHNGVTEDGWYCIGKPIIYLYPTQPTLVDVRVYTPGDIFISDPLYPEGGWKNILAHPSGKLEYEGNTYKELFYESNVKDVKAPLQGLTFKTETIEQELDHALTKLGLISYEKKDFIEFWAPKLRELNSPYIFFSILNKSEKERIDHVDITPKPDTFIGFIAYFKPLNFPFTGPELSLPKTPPERIGFTAVEWGGTLENTN